MTQEEILTLQAQRADWIFKCTDAGLEMFELKQAGLDYTAAMERFLKLKACYDAWKKANGLGDVPTPSGPNIWVKIPESILEKLDNFNNGSKLNEDSAKAPVAATGSPIM